MLGVVALSPYTNATAQQGFNRILIGRWGEAPERRQIKKFTPPDSATLAAKWLIQPLYSWAPTNSVLGALVGYHNTNRITRLPWQFDIRGTGSRIADSDHFSWQADVEADPGLGRVRLVTDVAYHHAVTSAVKHSDELAWELDFAITRDSSLTVGLIEYYDHGAPVNAPPADGFTTGVPVFWQISKRIAGIAEYDFPSPFTDAFDYAFGGSVLLFSTPGRTQASLRFGMARRSRGTVSIQVGIPNQKRVPLQRRPEK